MKKSTYIHLSGLMFLQLLVVGTYSPIVATYLKDMLHFSGAQVAGVLSSFQIASMIAPVVATFIVDRIVPARTLLAMLHLLGAGIALILASIQDFWPFLLVFASYAFFLGPTMGLLNAVAFARMPDGRAQYGSVRLWGTIGWIVAAWVLALIWLLPGMSMDWMFRLAALGSLAAGGVCLILPRDASSLDARKPLRIFPKEALQVFFQSSILRFGLLYGLNGILDRFYFIGTAPFLRQLGYSTSEVNFFMPFGQITEAILLLLTGPILKRFGLRFTLVLGLGFQLLRFAIFVFNPGSNWILGAIMINGFVFAFFYAVCPIFVDGHTDANSRGGVHQLIGLIFGGLSSLLGNLIAGYAFDWFSRGTRVDYGLFWLIPLVIACLSLCLVFVLVNKDKQVSFWTSPKHQGTHDRSVSGKTETEGNIEVR